MPATEVGGRVADICAKADFHPLTIRGWKIKGRAFIDRVGGSYKQKQYSHLQLVISVLTSITLVVSGTVHL